MKPLSLTTRLSLILACTMLVVMALTGLALYHSLAKQISVRDDGALLARMDQIRTLLRDEDAIALIHQKPRLFANMLGNTESLLMLRFPGQSPLIEVNPGQRTLPAITPMSAEQPLTLNAVHHLQSSDGTPFIAAAALANTRDGPGKIEIVTGRLMTERTQTLASYRDQIITFTLLATLLVALIAHVSLRRGLVGLRHLASETDAIDVRHLSHRIRLTKVPLELQPLVAAFNQMLTRLETGYQQLSQVSADMAHDLRTPVNTLIGQTEVALGQQRTSAEYQALLGSNYEELERLAKMIDNMLFLAKAEDASQAIALQPLDLESLGTRLADYFEGLAEERQMALRVELQGEVQADLDLLLRALANLLANALRYGDSGSVIRLFSETGANGVTISVENHGPTIPSERQARLFDRFWRADSSRHLSSSGSGLGLSIVRSIMQLHHGRCAVQSEQGLTRFTLYFPLKP